MTHLNFGRNNGKIAAVTSWGLGDVGGKLRLGGGGGGQLEAWEGSCPPPPSTPEMTPLVETEAKLQIYPKISASR